VVPAIRGSGHTRVPALAEFCAFGWSDDLAGTGRGAAASNSSARRSQ
jgi:hypothetical protein